MRKLSIVFFLLVTAAALVLAQQDTRGLPAPDAEGYIPAAAENLLLWINQNKLKEGDKLRVDGRYRSQKDNVIRLFGLKEVEFHYNKPVEVKASSNIRMWIYVPKGWNASTSALSAQLVVERIEEIR